MKLKSDLMLGSVDGNNFAVATGKLSKKMNGMIHNNETADFIFHLLQTDQTEDSIVSEMLKKYDVEESVVRSDVRELLSQLEREGLLEK